MAQLESYDDFTLTAVRDAWDTFRREALVFVLAAALLSVLSLVSLGLVTGPLTIGFLDMVRRARDGEPITVGMIFRRFDTFVASSVALVLIGIAVFLGMLLLVVPGLVAVVFATYTLPAIAYEGLGGVEAIRRSIELVRAHFLPTLAVLVVLWCVQALGSVVVIALLVTTPFGLILLSVAYERLERVEEASPGLVVEP